MRSQSTRISALLFAAAMSIFVAFDAHSESFEAKLASWYGELGAPRSSETFGHYLARTAQLQHGVKYDDISKRPGVETLEVDLDSFECVSFIESALAVARCGWAADANEDCFVRELEASRYRDGHMGNYPSRLHYFVDWIDDNEQRGRVRNLTESLGGEPVQKDFFYITERVLKGAVDAAELAAFTEEMKATEARLSEAEHSILTRESAPAVLAELEDGDLVAFVRERPGLLVHHAGFIYWANGTPRLLHASSYHGRVVITIRDVSNYLLRRPERRGVIVARPTAPQRH